jgi:FtsH-binding integral membrane protein
MVGGLTAYLTTASVLMSIGVLACVLCTMFTVFLCIPNKGKALMGLIIAMFVAVIIQLVVMISLLITGYVEGMWVLYCTMGVILCAGLIYFDLFIIMMAGKHAMDEYILCSVLLYVDIIRMLLYLLMIFGKAK